MSENTSNTSTKVSGTSKIPIRIGSDKGSVLCAQRSRIPARFCCDSGPKPKKNTEKPRETLSTIKNRENAFSLCASEGITEPHRLTTSDPFLGTPKKGSEGDQLFSGEDEKKTEVDISLTKPKLSVDVLMKPRVLQYNTSRDQMLPNDESKMTVVLHREDSTPSICADESCEVVGEVNELGAENETDDDEVETQDVWVPVSDYLKKETEMRTKHAQTSEASVDDFDFVEFRNSQEKVHDVGKMRPLPVISEIKIKHIIPKPSALKMKGSQFCVVQEKDRNSEENQEEEMQNTVGTEKVGDLKRNSTYTVFTEENFKDEESETTTILGDGDGMQVSTEEDNKVCAEIAESTEKDNASIQSIQITPEVLRKSYDPTPRLFEVYPQALLMIPDVNRCGGYIATLKIVNNGENPRAYKIFVNRCAHDNLLIEPQFGILPKLSEVTIEVTSRYCHHSYIGGLSQNSIRDAILEVRSIEIFNIINQDHLASFWRAAEARYSNLINSVTIKSINVLEPRNADILDAIDEPERSIYKEVLKAKYHNEMVPKMIENRRHHMMDQELMRLERRVKNVWHCIRHLDWYCDLGFSMAYNFIVFWWILPYIASEADKTNDTLKADPEYEEKGLAKYVIDQIFAELTKQ